MNIMIVYGGKSVENDISVITACLARGHFAGNLYGVYFDKKNVPYFVGNDVSPKYHVNIKRRSKVNFLFGEGAIEVKRRFLPRRKIHIDVAVNCCHGVCGEDGTVAALCQLCGIPLVGSDIVSSAVAIDKVTTKRVLLSLNLPVLPCTIVKREDVDFDVDSVDLPTVVKPSRLGSSIGVTFCRTAAELSTALQAAFCYDGTVLCEQGLTDFTEYNCSAMRIQGHVQVSGVDIPKSKHDILTFEDKYIQDGGKYLHTDRNICKTEIASQVQSLTREIYVKLAFSGVIRVDFIRDNTDGKLYVNEINSVPGSLAYGLWSNDYGMTEYGAALVQQAIDDFHEESTLITEFSSDVLSGSKGKK